MKISVQGVTTANPALISQGLWQIEGVLAACIGL